MLDFFCSVIGLYHYAKKAVQQNSVQDFIYCYYLLRVFSVQQIDVLAASPFLIVETVRLSVLSNPFSR